ncbi:hypothetical protein TBLA_0E02170 [Henningerozyma blattae CBS 6284]|uniref:Uncharacterized protein n=1 Tax=Henningerozyma blattae (strain ATCC 34711 / CBS 6284 / DSM 70876 / NBRC 10599 / NRRL Y-10934 / UCD 77-7) TaxID=1071380 RepID=I2H4G8_HENB6|nr:hypothetical protein TBLA_0E02170 [Tetrapisispora blattae CBS 6284]CCH61270.1 hypothetical protein TBLA_0E02170 [Tetrapisispora blattae CBS 6284]
MNMFAAIASGNPLQLSTDVPNSNGLQHTIVLSSTKPKFYSHITLFILPNVTFPENYVATIFFKLAPNEDFKLFGYLDNEKPSAIFKVKLPNSNSINNDFGDGLGEIDMDDDDDATSNSMSSNNTSYGMAPNPNNLSQVIIGISIEPQDIAREKLAEWRASKMSTTNNNNSLVVSKGIPDIATALNINTAGQLAKTYPALTEELAGKIVQHAYNYLSGFLDPLGNVSIKRFDSWWDKFKARLANDGTFLDEVTKD